MPKAYVWDWSLVQDSGARFENLVASHLLKFVHDLQDVDDAEALLVVLEAARDQGLQDALAGVAERRVPEIVAEHGAERELERIVEKFVVLRVPHIGQMRVEDECEIAVRSHGCGSGRDANSAGKADKRQRGRKRAPPGFAGHRRGLARVD